MGFLKLKSLDAGDHFYSDLWSFREYLENTVGSSTYTVIDSLRSVVMRRLTKECFLCVELSDGTIGLLACEKPKRANDRRTKGGKRGSRHSIGGEANTPISIGRDTPAEHAAGGNKSPVAADGGIVPDNLQADGGIVDDPIGRSPVSDNDGGNQRDS